MAFHAVDRRAMKSAVSSCPIKMVTKVQPQPQPKSPPQAQAHRQAQKPQTKVGVFRQVLLLSVLTSLLPSAVRAVFSACFDFPFFAPPSSVALIVLIWFCYIHFMTGPYDSFPEVIFERPFKEQGLLFVQSIAMTLCSLVLCTLLRNLLLEIVTNLSDIVSLFALFFKILLIITLVMNASLVRPLLGKSAMWIRRLAESLDSL